MVLPDQPKYAKPYLLLLLYLEMLKYVSTHFESVAQIKIF